MCAVPSQIVAPGADLFRGDHCELPNGGRLRGQGRGVPTYLDTSVGHSCVCRCVDCCPPWSDACEECSLTCVPFPALSAEPSRRELSNTIELLAGRLVRTYCPALCLRTLAANPPVPPLRRPIHSGLPRRLTGRTPGLGPRASGHGQLAQTSRCHSGTRSVEHRPWRVYPHASWRRCLRSRHSTPRS